MKKIISISCLLAAVIFAGCSKSDIEEVQSEVDDLMVRVEALESEVDLINSNIKGLQGLVTAFESNDYLTSVLPLTENGVAKGYLFSFANSSPVTIKDGEDALAPTIGVDKYLDGNYYWTIQYGTTSATWLVDENGNKVTVGGIDGEDGSDGADGYTPTLSVGRYGGGLYWMVDNMWLYVDGEMVPTSGSDGDDGYNGADGNDGFDGEDGADGLDGADGSTIGSSVAISYVDNGTTVTVKYGTASFEFTKATDAVSFYYTVSPNLNNSNGEIDVIMPNSLAEDDFVALIAKVTSTGGATGSEIATKSSEGVDAWGVVITPPVYANSKWSDATVTLTRPTNSASGSGVLTVYLVKSNGSRTAGSLVFTY